MADTLIAPVPDHTAILNDSENTTPAQVNIDGDAAAKANEQPVVAPAATEEGEMIHTPAAATNEDTSVKQSVSHTPRVHTPRVIQCDPSAVGSNHLRPPLSLLLPSLSSAQHEGEQTTTPAADEPQTVITAPDTAAVHHDIHSTNTSAHGTGAAAAAARGASAAPLHVNYSRFGIGGGVSGRAGSTSTQNNHNGNSTSSNGTAPAVSAANTNNNHNNKRSLVHIFGTLRPETAARANTAAAATAAAAAVNTRQRRPRMVIQHQALPTATEAAQAQAETNEAAPDTIPTQHVRPVMKKGSNGSVARPILMSTPTAAAATTNTGSAHKGRRTLLMPSTRVTTATTTIAAAGSADHNGKTEAGSVQQRRAMRPTTGSTNGSAATANANAGGGGSNAMALRRSRTEQLIERTTSHTSGLSAGSVSRRRSLLDEPTPSASRLTRALSCRPAQRHTLSTRLDAAAHPSTRTNAHAMNGAAQGESHRRPMLLLSSSSTTSRPRGRSQSAPRRTTFARHADPLTSNSNSEHGASTRKANSRSASTELLLAAQHTSPAHGQTAQEAKNSTTAAPVHARFAAEHTPVSTHNTNNSNNNNRKNEEGAAEMTPMTKQLLARAHSVPSSHVQPHTRAFQPRRLRPGRATPPRKSVNVYLSKYSLVRRVAAELGFDIQESEEELDGYGFNLCWSDTVLPLTRLVRLGNWQRTNHFPAMYLLCRKSHLGRTLGAMRKRMPAQYSFYPRTWMMRCERPHFEDFMRALQQRRRFPFFILKPNAGCQGRGIVVTRDPLHAVEDLDNYVVQEYIGRPMLIDGCKFDLRVYVLLTSIREPSIFLFNDGLVRLCTDPYEPPSDSNAKNACMHLTNYAVNKRSGHFVFNTDMEHYDVGNKRNFRFLNEWMTAQGHDPDALWKKVGFIIVKTILAAQPQIRDVYDTCFPGSNEGYTCFEMLGFDILIDSKARPWLMEVNHTPSLSTDTPLDLDIKRRLLREIWDIVDCQATDCQKDYARVRAEFTRRNMPPWATPSSLYLNNSHTNNSNNSIHNNNNNNSSTPRNGTTSSVARGGGTPGKLTVNSTISAAMGEGSEAAKALSPFAALEAAQELDEHGIPRYITARRASEDSRLHDFARIYPSADPEQQRVYDAIREVAGKNCLWSALPTLRTNSGNIAQYFNYYTTNSQLHTPARMGGSVASPTLNGATPGFGAAGSPTSGLMGSPSGHFPHSANLTTNTSTAANTTGGANNAGGGLNNGHTLIYTHHVLQDRLRRDRNRPTFFSYERIATPQSSLHSSARSMTTASSSIAGQAGAAVAAKTLTYQDLEPEMMRHRRRLDLQLDKHAEATAAPAPSEEEKAQVAEKEAAAAAAAEKKEEAAVADEVEQPAKAEKEEYSNDAAVLPEREAEEVVEAAQPVEVVDIPRTTALPASGAAEAAHEKETDIAEAAAAATREPQQQQQQPPAAITAIPTVVAPSVKPTTASASAEPKKLISLTAALAPPPSLSQSAAAAVTRARSRGHSPRPVINAAAALAAATAHVKKELSKGRESRSPPTAAAATLTRSPPQHATPSTVLSMEEVQWLANLQAQLDQDADADPERSREDSIHIDE